MSSGPCGRQGRWGAPTHETVERIGAAWTGGEALGIALLCALTDASSTDGVADSLWRLVAHAGDSDNTGIRSVAPYIVTLQEVSERAVPELPAGLRPELRHALPGARQGQPASLPLAPGRAHAGMGGWPASAAVPELLAGAIVNAPGGQFRDHHCPHPERVRERGKKGRPLQGARELPRAPRRPAMRGMQGTDAFARILLEDRWRRGRGRSLRKSRARLPLAALHGRFALE